MKELNFRVRDGNGWFLLAIVTGFLENAFAPSKLNNTLNNFLDIRLSNSYASLNPSWLSPRSISIGQLNTLLHLHLRPINHLVLMGPYYLAVWEILS